MKGGGSQMWIVMDASSQETTLDVNKYVIMDRLHIHARDLRILDPVLSHPSTVFGRDRAILLNLEHIKAIITAEEVFLRNPLDDNVTPLVEELRRRLKPTTIRHEIHEDDTLGGGRELVAHNDIEDELPFEFKVLEVLLEAICSSLAARTKELEVVVCAAIDLLTSKLCGLNFEAVRQLKSERTRLAARVQKVRNEFEQLLEDDDDMAELYLSRKLAGASSHGSGSGTGGVTASRFVTSHTTGSKMSTAGKASIVMVRGDEDDVEKVEMLLEAYYIRINDTLSKLNTLREYIDDTEDYINIRLENHRNQLMQLELVLSAGTLCMAIFSLITGIFGMNIYYS